MNRLLLETIMQLFAHLARADGVEDSEREVVKKYLASELPPHLSGEFLEQFNRWADQGPTKSLESLAKTANAELSNNQKYYTLARLIELTGADGVISANEKRALDVIAKAFGLPETDYADLYAYIASEMPRNLAHEGLLMVSTDPVSLTAAHYKVPRLKGYVAVQFLATPRLMLMRYMGTGTVTLNGQPVKPSQVYLLHQGSVFRNAGGDPVYYAELMEQFVKSGGSQTLHFEARHLQYRFPSGGVGLQDVSLVEEEGRLIAIMGASGAGKSTLLNVLNGNIKPTEGQVLLNGVNIHEEPERVRGLIGYVSQDDLLIEELTVFQNLYYNAKLVFGRKSREELRELVMVSLQELGLVEIADLKVGSPLNKKISGGQRKRLNIALELIRQPAVLFVDEPTSGLSSRDSENIMDLLRQLSRQGKVVFVVIHQPSSDIFKLFDSLIILDRGGLPIFYGHPLNGIAYFKSQVEQIDADAPECPTCGNVNVEQVFNIIEQRVTDELGEATPERRYSPEQWYARFKETHEPLQFDEIGLHEVPETEQKIAGRLRQFGVFFMRDLRAKLGNRSYLIVNLLQAPLLAALLAIVLRYYDAYQENAEYTLLGNENLPIFLFVAIIVALFLGMTVSAEEILRDRKIRKREQFLHLSKNSYLLSKVGLLLMLSAVQMLSYVLVANAIFGIQGMAFPYWLVLFSTTVFANLLGLNISATFDNAVTIYVLVPILLIPQIVLSGAMVRFERINPALASPEKVPWYGEIMASRWAFEALCVVQFKENAYEQQFYTADRGISQARWRVNFWVPEMEARLDALQKTGQTNLQLLENEFTMATNRFKGPFPVLEKLRNGSFSSTQDLPALRKLLADLETRSRNQLKAVRKMRDNRFRKLSNDLDLDALRKAHHNTALEDYVRNNFADHRIVESNDRLVQVTDPIFQTDPTGPGVLDVRTQLFTPVKFFLGNRVKTLAYNVLVLWLMTLLLYVTLYFETFRWVGQRLQRLLPRNSSVG